MKSLIVASVIIFFGLISNAQAADKSLIGSGFSSYVGRWSPSCNDIDGFILKNNSKIMIDVNENQININAYAIKKIGSLYEIYFSSPGDLGAGGGQLDWRDVSLEKPIANIEFSSDAFAKLHWNGFYSNAKDKYFWINNPDFYGKSGDIALRKCK